PAVAGLAAVLVLPALRALRAVLAVLALLSHRSSSSLLARPGRDRHRPSADAAHRIPLTIRGFPRPAYGPGGDPAPYALALVAGAVARIAREGEL
ncbi:hypothetical protein, partial [Streptomyces boncukensis]